MKQTKATVVDLKEGMIYLPDGSKIKGYLMDKSEARETDDAMGPDKSGKYLVIGNKKRNKTEEVRTEKELLEEKLFLSNAFFFVEHIDEIMVDSRMFLVPVPIIRVLAYSGNSSFKNPTLGIYLEWWCSERKVKKNN